MNILIAHGSERGGTAGIASRIGDVLREAGHTTDVLPARTVRDVTKYDAVVVGGALYAARWHEDAQRFVLRHEAALRGRPVWFFSSGPLDDSASHDDILPIPQVRQLMGAVGAIGHATFGGRLTPDAEGFIASRMARQHAGDWRSPARIESWARRIDRALEAGPALTRPVPTPLPSRVVPVALCLVAGISALFGGASLVVRPDGSLIGLPLSVLEHSPFHDFLIPGILLLLVIGVGNTWAAYLHLRRTPLSGLASFAAGGALVVWMVTEVIMLRTFEMVQVICLALGMAIVAESIRRVRLMTPPPVSGSPPEHSHA